MHIDKLLYGNSPYEMTDKLTQKLSEIEDGVKVLRIFFEAVNFFVIGEADVVGHHMKKQVIRDHISCDYFRTIFHHLVSIED